MDHSTTPLFVLGPTGTGKSAMAVRLAEQLGNAQIISADAYQVYRHMPIITAAPSADELARVPHHLIGFLDPTIENDAATHARRAGDCIRQLREAGIRPIITGGSGLYVKFISHGISPAPPSDPELRAQLTALPLEEAVRRFQELDPEGAAGTDLQNPRYVVRNLEIVILGGKPLSHWRNNWQQAIGPGFVITRDTVDLDARIAARTRLMLEQGAIEEVAALPHHQLSPTAAKTLGLPQIIDYLAGNIERAALADAIALATRQYAKRQRTWLRRESWLTPVSSLEEILMQIK